MKPHSVYTRIAVSCVAIAVGILAATSTLDKAIRRSVVSRWDEAGVRYLDNASVRALTTFAVVRGINGVISVFQGTDIALIIVFVLQTVLIPLLVLWLILKLLRFLCTGDFAARLERSFFRLMGAPAGRESQP